MIEPAQNRAMSEGQTPSLPSPQQQIELTCPVCGRTGIKSYRQRPPRFCSRRCRRRAARAREQVRKIRAFPLDEVPPGGCEGIRRGAASGPAAPLAAQDGTIWCYLCGRPLRPGEDFGQWRLRAVLPSPRYYYEIRAICPVHYPPAQARRHPSSG